VRLLKPLARIAVAGSLLVTALSLVAAPEHLTKELIGGAREQVGVTRYYDGAYRQLTYPGGDIPPERDVCTDVIVRAFRRVGIDLQVLVHEDMERAWARYPKGWGERRPNPNIDHRRVPNLQVFFARHGSALPVTDKASDYRPGEIVTWRLSSGLPHIGLVSDQKGKSAYLVIHNIGAGAQIEDVLFDYQITGHYRYPR
jgi:uncharacterized protein